MLARAAGVCRVLAPLGLLAPLLGCASLPKGRAAVDKVEVQGAKQVDGDEVTDKIATTASPKFLALFQGVIYDYEVYDPFVLQRDLARVERYYRARGFYEAHARAGRVEYVSPQHVRVTIVVDEGKPVAVGRVVVEGIERLPPDVQDAVRKAAAGGLEPGANFEEEKFDGAERAVKKALTDRGYAYTKVKRAASVDLPNHRADVTFGLVSERPVRLGKISIVGLGNIPEGPVRRALDLEEGEPYSTQRLDDAQQSLLDLGVFGAVDVQPDLSDPKRDAVPIVVRVEPMRLHSVRLGGGVELDVIKTDLHLLAGWEDHNFLGGLRHFRAEVKPGVVLYPTRLPDFQTPEKLLPEERSRVELNQPGFIEARTNGTLRGEFNIYPVLLVPNHNASDPVLGYREVKGAAGVDRTIWKLFSSFTYNAQVNYPFAYVGDIDPNLQSVWISYVDLLQHFDFRDDKVHPHQGLYIGDDFQFAGLGGDARDFKVQPEVRGYVPIMHRVTLAARGSVGFLFPQNWGDTLQTNTATGQPPPGVDTAAWEKDVQIGYLRGLFAGGPSSNRGWPLRGIGPHGVAPFFNPGLAAAQIAQECDPTQPGYDPVRCAVPLGGMSLWEASLELRVGVLSSAGEMATFCDTADVSAKQVDIRLRRPHLSCGLGFRYDTPVGPIRLDLAYRIPGLQSLDKTTLGDDEASPGTIFGQPIAVAFGIGEPF